MGFPVGNSELLLPRMLLRIALLLGCLRRLLLAAFDAVGLGDLLDADIPWPDYDAAAAGGSSIQPQPQPPPDLEQALPAVRYEELLSAAEDEEAADGWAVCLCEFERRDEMRRLGNCRHVFHRGCLDRWVMENDQSTCPLCRAPLVRSPSANAHYDDDDDYYYYHHCHSSPRTLNSFLRRSEVNSKANITAHLNTYIKEKAL